MAWTEIGLDDKEYAEVALNLRATYSSWEEVNGIILGDVLGSFALDSAILLLAFIPLIGLLLISPFPDWGYDERYLRKRLADWQRKPRWVHYLNPFRLIGYPVGYLFSLALRLKLKAAYYAVVP